MNWIEKVEELQKRREKQASRNLGKLTPPPLQSQIEILIACLKRAVGNGGEASSCKGGRIAGSGGTSVGSIRGHL